MLFQPFPVYFRPSRYWLIRHVGKLFLSGTRRVEFTDFWMGDQFCSLVFTLSNLFLIACTYAHNFPEDWSAKCSSSQGAGPGGHGWLFAFALASVPFVIRLVQSVKRYLDSKLITHLINGGKYANGIISYFFYFLWKHSGQSYGKAFAFWCLFNTCYSIYACTWDFLMDWSVLQPRSKNRFLRNELVYHHQAPLYYFAMVSNLLIRFIWVIYIPHHDSSAQLRAFLVGLLEVLRRWQWNFFRLENEHIGNMDQYRVTREVPLPYVFDDHSSHQDRDDDDDEDNYKVKKR
ncbi:EXS-domain-containing protein [Panaeolus papilionaceus]|nr:EXS-domain-containing protein [Panaeolus papilionaceus]